MLYKRTFYKTIKNEKTIYYQYKYKYNNIN